MSGDVSKFFDSIEDVVAQADEVDEKYLQVSSRLIQSACDCDKCGCVPWVASYPGLAKYFGPINKY